VLWQQQQQQQQHPTKKSNVLAPHGEPGFMQLQVIPRAVMTLVAVLQEPLMVLGRWTCLLNINGSTPTAAVEMGPGTWRAMTHDCGVAVKPVRRQYL
jgi:hypothetical protein